VIDKETIATIKERTDIVELIGDNVRLAKRGRRYVGLCPFHKETAPSFSVNRERGFFHCFGCKESGTAIDYLMKLEGLSFPEAVRLLAERSGIALRETSDAELERSRQKQRERDQLFAINQLAATFFEQQLRRAKHPLASVAARELDRRGLPLDSDDPAVAEALSSFRVGYAPYAWDGLARFLREQSASVAVAESLGLVAARAGGSGHYDRFRHRLMFAVLDLQGRVVGFSGRALDEPSAEELRQRGLEPLSSKKADERPSPPPKYINSPESAVYQKGATVFGLYQARSYVRHRQEAVVVEGNFDVLALHARGLRRAVAPLGTALTVEQAKLVKRYAPTLTVLFDADEAGRKAVRAARQPAAQADLLVRVATLPEGADPDDYVRAQGVEALERVLAGARGMLDHLIDLELSPQSFRGASLREQQERIKRVAELLASENDPNLRQLAKAYADRLSSQLIVGGQAPSDMRQLERMVVQSIERGGDRGAAPPPVLGPQARSLPRLDDIPLAMLGAILDFPDLLDDPQTTAELPLLEGAVAMGVDAVQRWRGSKKSLQASELLDLMPVAIHAYAAGRLVSPQFDDLREAKAELLDNAKKLRRLAREREKALKLQEISQAQGLGDNEAEDELLRELDRRAREKLGLS